MAYATVQNMLDYFGSQELSQLATPRRYKPVDVELLELAITNGDTSGYPPNDVALAEKVVEIIELALEDASLEMDSYIRIHNKLPLNITVIYSSPLLRKNGDIARWILAKSHPSEEITERYEIALKYLTGLSNGSVRLPSEDTTDSPSSTRVTVGHTEYSIDWSTY